MREAPARRSFLPSHCPYSLREAAAALGLAFALSGCPAPTMDGPLDLMTPVDASQPPADLSPCVPPQVDRAPAATVAVLPDEGLAPFASAIARAQRSVRVLIYLMGTGDVLDALKAKAQAGVDVRIILDKGQSANQKYAAELQQAGASIVWSDPSFTYMHAKVLIVDDQEAVVSTGNYSAYWNDQERNLAVDLKDPIDLRDLIALFEADWGRRAPDLGCTRLLVSPINSKARLIALIDSARESLLIESMQFAEYGVRDAVAARKAAGVDVRVLLADPAWVSANKDAAAFLSQHNIPARWMNQPDVHVKTIVIDGAGAGAGAARAYVGSENLSYTSLTKNREVGVILSERAAIQTITATIEKDWAKAVPF